MDRTESKYLKSIDFHFVEPSHGRIHERLENWARWCSPRTISWHMSPIFKLGRSNGRQWHQPVLMPTIDGLDAVRLETEVGRLPPMHRDAVRWCYVLPFVRPSTMCRSFWPHQEPAESLGSLAVLVRDGRSMLKATCG